MKALDTFLMAEKDWSESLEYTKKMIRLYTDGAIKRSEFINNVRLFTLENYTSHGLCNYLASRMAKQNCIKVVRLFHPNTSEYYCKTVSNYFTLENSFNFILDVECLEERLYLIKHIVEYLKKEEEFFGTDND